MAPMTGCIPFATAALTLPTESDVRLVAPLVASSPAAAIVLTLTDGFPVAPIARGLEAVPTTFRLLLPSWDSALTAPGWRLPVDSAVALLLTSKLVSAVAPPATPAGGRFVRLITVWACTAAGTAMLAAPASNSWQSLVRVVARRGYLDVSPAWPDASASPGDVSARTHPCGGRLASERGIR